MAITGEMTGLLRIRRDFYRLLSRLYILEVDEQLLSALMHMEFPADCGDEEMAEGYALLRSWLDSHGGESLEDLAVDYARVFLSAGVAEGSAAFPYESVYTSGSRLMMQDARSQAVAAYDAHGLVFRTDTYHVPEDHLAIELEFMACLCGESLAAEDQAALEASLKEQGSFLREHLLGWVPAFCADLNKYASTDFYKAVGKLTRGFLNLERKLLGEMGGV